MNPSCSPGLIILVVGMHRSGTSLVARGLHAMGANLGQCVDTQPHPANPHGHWEHAQVWQAQERLLIRFGREWHSCPGPLPPRWLEWPDTATAIDQFTTLATSELTARGHWVVKDPRTSLLIPLWKVVAARAGAELRILRVYRNAAQVVASLSARDAMPPTRAMKAWMEHQRSIDRDARGLVTKTFRHAAIMRAPLSAFSDMGVFCGLPDADTHARIAAAHVDHELWHHREELDADTPPVFADEPPPADGGCVAVVLRTRWRLHVLPRAVRSVLSQTYPHWWLQIVNDGGPPHAVEREIEPYRHLLAERLGILHLDRQRGMEAASNAGIAAAPGTFIAIHDDDDTWSPDFLERMVTRLNDGGCDAVVSRSRLVHETWDGTEYVRRRVVAFGPTLERVTPDDLAQENRFPPISFLFRRSVYDAVGPFHEGLPALGDWHFNKRVAAREPILVQPEELASWHRRDATSAIPNSPPDDHARCRAFVRDWPAAAPMPNFFAQMRQVRLWDGVVGASTSVPEGSGLPTGLYLVQLPVAGTTDGGPTHDGWFHCHIDDAPGGVSSIPLAARADQPTTVLLNAPEPILHMEVESVAGTRTSLPPTAKIARLGPPLSRLTEFAGPPRLPDVLCIGAQRGGTTWLHAMLQLHPAVWNFGIKEFHQFDWDGDEPTVGTFRQRQALFALSACADATSPRVGRDEMVRSLLRHAFPTGCSWENYAASFAAAPRDLVACDFTPAYATLDDPDVAEILRMMPDVKVIFLLRDPVTRAISGALHALAATGVDAPTIEQLRTACASTANSLRTDYVRTLDTWNRHLPPGRLLVLFHDDIAHAPNRMIARCCHFLGIASPSPDMAIEAALASPRNAGTAFLAWPELAQLKAELSERWLPMLRELEHRFDGPATQWRLAAEKRIEALVMARAGAGAGRDNTVASNLAQWDMRHSWANEGDEWAGQARACGVAYDEWKAGILARSLPLFPRGGTLLEIGAGHGRWSEMLIDHAGTLVLCDISPNCLDACRRRLMGRGRLRTHVSQAADLPADLTGDVDAIWSYDCFVHVEPDACRRYLAEIARVLRPGGVAVLHHADRAEGLLPRMTTTWRGWWQRRATDDPDHGWRSSVSRKAMRRWAEAAGLVVERQERTWICRSPQGTVVLGVPRFHDCITTLRKPHSKSPITKTA